jgi:hypothetical protein
MHGLEHALEVKSSSFGVPVRILEDRDSDTLEDGTVVGYKGTNTNRKYNMR